MEVFEKGSVPKGYERMNIGMPELDARLLGCRPTKNGVLITSDPYISAGEIAKPKIKERMKYEFDSREDLIAFMTSGAEEIKADALEIILTIKGEDIPCPEKCTKHKESFRLKDKHLICKNSSKPDKWYGIARPYKLKED